MTPVAVVAERVLVDSGPCADMRRKRDVEALVAEQPLDVLREDLAGPHPEL